MNAFKVKLSDGDTEWWETIKAQNLDHLYDVIDSGGYDVVDFDGEVPSPAVTGGVVFAIGILVGVIITILFR
tara:strand:- start:769 stop:984 length:216 start_codon:yes stop_codon:yes gene_type:complete